MLKRVDNEHQSTLTVRQGAGSLLSSLRMDLVEAV